MRITHSMSRLRLADGGVVRAVLDLALLMAQQGHSVRLLTFDATDAPAEWKAGTNGNLPEVIELPAPTRLMGFPDRALVKQVGEHLAGSDVLHLHTPWDPPNLAFAREALRRNVPYVVTVHGMLDDWCMAQKSLKKRLYLGLGGRRFLERAALVHCTAEAELHQARRWFPRGRGVVIPLVMDLAPFRELPDPATARAALPFLAGTDDPIVLFLSRLHPKKRVEVVIDTAHALREAGVRCRTIIAGSGDDAYGHALRERINRLGLGERVQLVGLITGAAKVALFRAAKVFVLPTSQENFGYVLIEAMAAGTPVVTTKGVDIWPELEQTGGAIIAEPTPEAFAGEVRQLLADSPRREKMGEAARAWVLREFDGFALVRRFMGMYAAAAGQTDGAEREP